jgi:hypothetical protein
MQKRRTDERNKMRCAVASAALAATILAGASGANAVEGGSGAYLLGSRDLMAGFVPPPGQYVNMDFIWIDGSVSDLAIGGVAVTDARTRARIFKPGVTYVAPDPVAGGRVALNVQAPMASVNLDFTGILGGLIAGTLSNEEVGFADPSITPIIGWDAGAWHVSLSMPIYVPLGLYDTATVSLSPPGADVLSLGKNKWGFDPTVAWTWLDTASGLEMSGALGITLSTINSATDYQTAPELHLELTLGQHFENGLVAGVTGYYYQQLDNDSGSGAEQFQRATGAKTLQARVFGVGPVLNWNTKIGATPVTFEAKYLHELGAKRRFESDILWASVVVAF